jgi:beta-phosphoglucomutase-like phosphatase (HAD superfamily)
VPLRAIVFDFDGVIANSEPLHFRGYRDVLVGEGIAVGGATTTRTTSVSTTWRSKRSGRHGTAWSSEQIKALVTRKAVRLEELERDVSVLFGRGRRDSTRAAACRSPSPRSARR